METDEPLVPFILLTIAFSAILINPLQKIERSIQEFPSKVFFFVISPISVVVIFFILFIVIVLRITFHHRSHTKYKKEKIEKLPQEDTYELDENEKDEGWDFEEINEEENLEEESSPELKPSEKHQRSVNIKVDSDKRYFHKKNISKDEVEYLLNEGYQIKKYKNLLNGKMGDFLLQPRHNESFTHLFLTKNISEFLEKNGIETELFVTKKPDIVFEIDGKRFAIEIETGSIFSKISRMKEKLEVLENYDKWFFVVTDRNKVKKYKKYGDAVDKRYVKSRLDKLVKLAKKSQK